MLGGGAIGIELGTALRKLGSEVQLVEQGDRLLPGMPASASADMNRALSALGVSVHTGTAAVGMTDAGVRVRTAEGAEQVLPADLVLVAVGRVPNTGGLGLERAGVSLTDSGHVQVDEALLATPNIAAIGDVIVGPGLAHRASAQATTAVASLSGTVMPWQQVVPLVVFADPEVAAVGLSIEEALAAGYEAAESVTGFSYSGKAHILQRTEGSHRIVTDTLTGLVVGGSVVGPHATELIGELAVAVECGLTLDDLRLTVHPHPTLSEILVEGLLRPPSTTTQAKEPHEH